MKAVTIVGRGESWKECPFDTKEIWGAATCLITPGLADHKYTKVFAFDNDDLIRRASEEAKRRNIPLMSSWSYGTEIWPVREVVRELRSSYFMDTISRMLGYAIYQKYTHLHVYGIDYGPQWEHVQSKSIVSFWLGYALAKGIDLTLGRGSLRYAYNLGPPPSLDAESVEVPQSERISEHVCVSV